MTTVHNSIEAGAGGEGILHERITTLQQDHMELKTSVERKFDHVSASIAAIANDIKERARVNWQPIGILLTFVTVVGGLVYYPVKDNQARTEETLKILAEKGVSEKELTGVLSAIKDRRDDQARQNEARFERVEADIDAMQKAVVPRGELEANWAAQRARDAELQRQLDDQRSRVESIYSPRDAITSLQHTVEDLQRAQIGGRR